MHSPVGLDMMDFSIHIKTWTHYSLYFKHEVNNSSATTVVKPCFTLCLVCSMV